MRQRAIVVLVLVCVLVTACGGAPPGRSLDGREFVAVAVTEAGAPRPLVPGTSLTLDFRDGRIGIAAGCNHIGGAYRVDGDSLIVGDMAMTAMGCDPARHAQDDWISAFMGSGPRLTLEGPNLALESGATRITFVDRDVALPDAALVGTRWLVESLIVGDAVSSVPGEVTASLVLGADGMLVLEAGCNSGGGPYALEDGTLAVGDLTLTRRACSGAAPEVEATVLAVLAADVVEYEIDADGLTLKAGESGLVLRAERPTP